MTQNSVPEPSSAPRTQEVPDAPTGSPSFGPVTKERAGTLAIMWATVGALASVGGAIVGFILGAASAPDCSGLLCGLEDALYGGATGWAIGALVAVNASVVTKGSDAISGTARAMSTILGVITPPVLLVLLVAF